MEWGTPLGHTGDIADTAPRLNGDQTPPARRRPTPVSTLEKTAAHALPSRGLTVALAHERYTFVALSGDTREAGTVVKIVTDPGAGQPLHVHHREDEAWMVLEGTYTIRVGDRTRTFGPGALVVAPKNVPHSYINAGSTSGTLMCTVWPAGRFERLLMELGRVVADADDPPPAGELAGPRAFALAAPKYGIEVVADATAEVAPRVPGRDDGFEPGEQIGCAR